jgi:cell pole-organizing protein PopZ
MEEILASIRRIISEDDKPEGEASASSAASGDVLELTEVAEEEEEAPAEDAAEEPPAEVEADAGESAPEEAAAEEESASSIDDVLNEIDTDDELELRDESEMAPAVEAPRPTQPPPTDASLLERATTASAVGSLSSLVAAVDRAHGGTTLGDGNRTIEDLLKEVMRPMVKEWLDANLPSLTERLVRREIERLARYADDD